MVGFQLPKSTYVPSEKFPPEAADISLILNAALAHTPDIVPILTLAATTGARLGELVALRRSDIDWERKTLWIRSSTDVGGSLKEPKRAQHRRDIPVDDDTLALLQRQVDDLTDRVAFFGVDLAADAFLFSNEPDCVRPILSGTVTKRLQVLKDHLGVDDKRPQTKALEDSALRLRRTGMAQRNGRPGPPPKDGAATSYADIGKTLGRSEMWARRACDSALRRERTAELESPNFSLSFIGLRKFTSGELLDAGFNISVVARRQGHGPQVLAKHYSKARMPVRRKAADHLGRVVHGTRGPTGASRRVGL
jgi:integrase